MGDLLVMSEVYNRIFEKIKHHLKWSDSKIGEWFLTSNPMLGEVKPFKLITMGRGAYLEKWVDASLEENYRDGEFKPLDPNRTILIPPKAFADLQKEVEEFREKDKKAP